MATGIVDPEKSQPYAPEGAARIGAPPVDGAGGERGSNAFGGTDEFNADGSVASASAPSVGPATGKSYHSTEGGVTSSAHGGAGRSTSATAGGLLVPVLVVTASSLTPTAGASVTLTATASSGSTTLVSGTVTFKEGATTLGTGALSSEVATYVKSSGFTAGSHTITASVPASAGFEAKTSAPITIVAT